ncbi:hypothetical protein VNI00_016271 [Paramarasmius palmivorus]|uniref:Uncharacterized protein n=1 Tax=Paramarasmius palmivorus TaxID=297713 RepID=A0AAW0BEB7_9AGAR
MGASLSSWRRGFGSGKGKKDSGDKQKMRYFLRSHAKFTLHPTTPQDSPTANPPGSSCGEEEMVEPVFVRQRVDIEALIQRAEEDALRNANVAEDLGIHILGSYSQPASHTSSTCTAESQPQTIRSPLNHGQSHAHKKRAEKRREKRKNEPAGNSEDRVIREAIKPAAVLKAEFDGGRLDASRGVYTGNRGGRKVLGTQRDIQREYDVQELVDMGFEHVTWDGTTARPIVINEDLVIGVLAGRPRKADFKQDMEGIHSLLLQKGRQHGLQTRGEEEDDKRGDFPARSRGYTMGMGSGQPVVLNNGEAVNGLLTELVQDQRIIRLNGYQNVSTMHNNITKEDSERGRNFKKSAFTTIAFNFGGKVRCWKHQDQQNLPLGWCAITALGRFDPTQSARLILWELKLVIDFPPGSTILIPSAVITHSNTRIAEGDERTSITQYTAGAIFRWVDAGCKTDKALKAHDVDAWKEHERKKGAPVSERLGIFSRVNEVLSKAAN